MGPLFERNFLPFSISNAYPVTNRMQGCARPPFVWFLLAAKNQAIGLFPGNAGVMADVLNIPGSWGIALIP